MDTVASRRKTGSDALREHFGRLSEKADKVPLADFLVLLAEYQAEVEAHQRTIRKARKPRRVRGGPCVRCGGSNWKKATKGRRCLDCLDRLTFQRYGITPERYAELLAAQGGVCAICKKPCPAKRRLSVDHCHATGRVRGLLCIKCNVGLGGFRDNPQYLVAAVRYLVDAPP